MNPKAARVVVILAVLGAVSFQSGATADRSAAPFEVLISSVTLGSPTHTSDDCSPPDIFEIVSGFGIGQDVKSWPADGQSTCPNNRGCYIGATVNPSRGEW